MRLHPNIGQVSPKKLTELSAALKDPDIRVPAIDAIRSLIEQVIVSDGAAGVTLALKGAITAMIDLPQPLVGEVDLKFDRSAIVALRKLIDAKVAKRYSVNKAACDLSGSVA